MDFRRVLFRSPRRRLRDPHGFRGMAPAPPPGSARAPDRHRRQPPPPPPPQPRRLPGRDGELHVDPGHGGLGLAGVEPPTMRWGVLVTGGMSLLLAVPPARRPPSEIGRAHV